MEGKGMNPLKGKEEGERGMEKASSNGRAEFER